MEVLGLLKLFNMARVLLISIVIINAIVGTVAQDIPYRNEDTYTLELGMEYKKVPVPSTTTFKPGQTTPITNKGSDFYLLIKLNITQLLETDFRIKITNNHGDVVLSKRLNKLEEFVIDIGRSTEIKNGKAPNEYKIEFIGTDKTTKSIITLEFTEIGIFNVNEVQFGQI